MRRIHYLFAVLVSIFCSILPLTAQLNFSKVVIDTSFAQNTRPTFIKAADLNGDTITDILLSSPDNTNGDSSVFAWYQNDGNEFFSKTVIDTDIVGGGEFDVADLDGDLDNDIVMGASSKISWYENDSSGSFVKNLIDFVSAVRVMFIIDLDQDQDEDIVFLNNFGVFWQNNDGEENFTRDTVEAVNVTDNGLAIADLDSDLDNDIVTAIRVDTAYILVWYMNDGDENFTRDTVDIYPETLSSLVVNDLDDDGDEDIISVHGNRENTVIWYRNDGSENFARDTISVSFVRLPVSLRIVDLDTDGDKDIVVTGGNNRVGEVVYFENDGDENFLKRTIDNSPGNRQRVIVTDIDDDNDRDLLVTNTFPAQLVLYRNDGLPNRINETKQNMPGQYSLEQNFPNPFNPVTQIGYSLPAAGHVVIEVFNILGQKITTLIDRRQSAGNYRVTFDSRDLPSGLYFYRLQAGSFSELRKMVILK